MRIVNKLLSMIVLCAVFVCGNAIAANASQDVQFTNSHLAMNDTQKAKSKHHHKSAHHKSHKSGHHKHKKSPHHNKGKHKHHHHHHHNKSKNKHS